MHSQLSAAVEIVVHLVREPGGGRRRVAEVCLLRRGDDGLVGVVPAVVFSVGGEVERGPGAAALAARLGGRWSPGR